MANSEIHDKGYIIYCPECGQGLGLASKDNAEHEALGEAAAVLHTAKTGHRVHIDEMDIHIQIVFPGDVPPDAVELTLMESSPDEEDQE